MHPTRLGTHSIALFMALSVVALSAAVPAAFAADETTAHDHSHAAAGTAAKQDGAGASDMMQQMSAMHARMMAAKTPAERAALMRDQMAMMQSGMSMMQGMQGASAKRMDMMQMMMEMMMDRLSTPASETSKPDAPK